MAKDTSHNITVIIPTMAESKRRESLLNAIDSIINQVDVDVMPLVIVNGDRFDEDLNEELKKRADIRYKYLTKGDSVEAIQYGVKQVDTTFFSFLDDDDIYLEDALSIRMQPMNNDGEVGLSVAGGYKHGLGEEYLLPFDEKEYSADPLAALLVSPWLSSCSGLYRTSLINLSFFYHDYRYMEWTYLAFAISRTVKVSFTQKPTFLINFSEDSLSASPLMEVTRARLMDEISHSGISKTLKKQFLDKKYAAYHMASEIYLSNKEIFNAWKYHLRCLINIRGLKYIPYTYHLCRGSFFL